MATPTSTPEIFAGTFKITGTDDAGDGGPSTSAQLFYPAAIAGDKNNNIYVVDDCRVRKITYLTNIISTVAGKGTCSLSEQTYGGDGGLATQTTLADLFDVAVDSALNLYIGDEGGARFVAFSTGIITTFDTTTFSSLAINPITDEVYLADFIGNQIYAININTGVKKVVAGTGTAGYTPDGYVGILTSLNNPYTLRFIPNSQTFVYAEIGINQVRSINLLTSTLTTIAGTSLSSPPVAGPADPLEFNLHTPWSLATSSDGSIVIGESNGGNPNTNPLNVYLLTETDSSSSSNSQSNNDANDTEKATLGLMVVCTFILFSLLLSLLFIIAFPKLSPFRGHDYSAARGHESETNSETGILDMEKSAV